MKGSYEGSLRPSLTPNAEGCFSGWWLSTTVMDVVHAYNIDNRRHEAVGRLPQSRGQVKDGR